MSTAHPTPIPIALIGLHTEIGGPVAEGLRPEYDVTRFIQSYAAATTDLPPLLRGEVPPNPATNTVGSGAARPVRAVLFGRGFTQQQAEALRAAHGHLAPSVLWVAGSAARGPPEGSGPPADAHKVVVPVFRRILEEELGEGKEGKLMLY
ncbi:hypothetical protein GGS24DRAFT_502688 [Hypoxylon argillaceum]|nr:hypothetical protein GGS24DRAFT_502688 [Hypoxylon argillaceum]